MLIVTGGEFGGVSLSSTEVRAVTKVLNVVKCSILFASIGDGIWLSRTMARGGQSSLSANRSSGSDVERSLLREWGW